MVWQPRVCGDSLYHHIYAWGNDRHPVFKAPFHFEKYLNILTNYSQKLSVFIIAYALMEYHVHLFVYDRNNNISQFMKRLHGDYAKYYNHINNRTSHVFGERFNNKIVFADLYGKWLSRYIHRQAVEAGIVADPIKYEWTSYGIYIGAKKCTWLKPEIILSQFGDEKSAPQYYKDFVLNGGDDPVNWDERRMVFNADVVCDLVCKELNIQKNILISPRGLYDRSKRYAAINLLINKYDLKLSHVAALLQIERRTLYNILNR
jgi:putative transposase